jgi:2-methylcitrate dehydratase
LSLAAAAAGFDGPPQPFEGPHGWLGSIAAGNAHLTLAPDTNEQWRITRSLLKTRGACGTVIPSILAAELAALSVADPRDIVAITVHTYRDAVRKCASGPHHWAPTTRETADHSIPFAVSAALVDGTASTPQFDQTHLDDPLLQALTKSVTVLEDPQFTARYESEARDHFTRVEVGLSNGSVVVGEVGGDVREISDGMTDDEVQTKLEQAAAGLLPTPALELLTKALWELDDVDDVSILPPLLVVDR